RSEYAPHFVRGDDSAGRTPSPARPGDQTWPNYSPLAATRISSRYFSGAIRQSATMALRTSATGSAPGWLCCSRETACAETSLQGEDTCLHSISQDLQDEVLL